MVRRLCWVCLLMQVACGSSDGFQLWSLAVGTVYEGQSGVVVVAEGTGLSPSAVVELELDDSRLAAYADRFDAPPEVTAAADGRHLAFTIDIPAMPELDAQDSAELQVSITAEDEDGERQTERATLTIVGLDELSLVADLSPVEISTDELDERYSFISLVGPLRLVGSEPVVLRSTGELRTGDITILDASGGSQPSGGPGLCAELGYGASIANGAEAGPGGCAGGQPAGLAACTSTGERSAPTAALVPPVAYGGAGGDGGALGSGGTGGGGGGVVHIDVGRLRVPGLLQITADGASGCPSEIGDDHGRAGGGGAIWLRVRDDLELTSDHGFSALPGFADRELLVDPGLPGAYRIDLPRALSADEAGRFFASDRTLGEHPFADAPDQGAAFAAGLFQGPALVFASPILAEATVNMVGGAGADVDVIVDGQVAATVAGGGRQDLDLDLEQGLHEVCVAVAGAFAVSPETVDCRTVALLRQ